jgi:hypothetical protein
MFCREADKAYYELLFNLESYLRFVVRWELRAHRPRDWRSLIGDEVLEGAQEKLTQEQGSRYFESYAMGFLAYCSLSELRDIILGPLWAISFSRSWGAYELVSADFKKLIAIRNKIAHFRAISQRDISTINLFTELVSDWTRDYSRQARFAQNFVLDDEVIEEDKKFKKLPFFLGKWKSLRSRNLDSLELCVKIVGSYMCLEIKTHVRRFDPESINELITRYQTEIVFLVYGRLGDSLQFYLPTALEEEALASSLEHVLGACKNLIDEASSQFVQKEFDRIAPEFVFSDSFQLPLKFEWVQPLES